jgi:signal transduction histidine kinase
VTVSTTLIPLRVLVAEDSEDDFEILLRELKRGGYEVVATRVASPAQLDAALGREWDLVISDWMMPGFGGRVVLDTLSTRGVKTPCIVISGTIGEEPAVEALKAGALDFLSKDKPKRFAPVVERALREAAERIRSEEIRRRSIELELQNRRIQEANRLKSEFLANMSHELRTPLNAIIGFAELLHDGAVDPATPQYREFLGDILTSGKHLLQLINDVLDLAKVEAGKLEFRPEKVELGKVVQEISAILRTTVAAKRIRLETDLDASIGDVFLDPGRLKQIAYNYLSNAMKFSPPGGKVTLRITKDGDTAFKLEVSDEGIGIAEQDLGKLFVEFQQLEAGTAKRHQGTGLGLALTKRLVEAQGGAVGVMSKVGAGSTFFAVIPRRVEALTELALPRVPTRERVRRKGAPAVLVVEDDAGDQAQLVSTLAAAGYDVELAGTGADALAKWRQRMFDAVTIDLLLPDMSGLDLLSALSADPRATGVPIIVVTVVPDTNVVAGFAVHDVIHKPLDTDSLIASLVRAGVTAAPRGEAS